MPAPTRAPAFEPLTRLALAGLGWHPRAKSRRGFAHAGFPDIDPPWESGLPPEVVFRVLNQLRVGFAGPVEDLLSAVEPNAAHVVAAELLAQGGSVWTPNFDTAIERAFDPIAAARGTTLRRSLGELAVTSEGDYPERNFADAAAGSLVKFHGSADIRGSLAFTDLELLTPLSASQIAHLSPLAAGAHLVFYGYQGADADLHDLLVEAIKQAAHVTWFVVRSDQREFVARVYSGLSIDFQPAPLDPDMTRNLRPCADAFLTLADGYGLTASLNPTLRHLLGEASTPREPEFHFRPTALVHASLVERFGDPNEHLAALHVAIRADLRHPSLRALRTIPKYARWVIRASLYGDGIAARIIDLSMRALRRPLARRIAGLPLVRRYRDTVLNKGPALLLAKGRWHELKEITAYAVSVRHARSGDPQPDDQYYRGHALRYDGEFAAARDAQRAAEAGLSGAHWRRSDPERLAGAILEHGILDVYQGLFTDALERSDDLKSYRGRYAIQRWASWGYWLAGTAKIYLLDLAAADRELDIAYGRFSRAHEPRHVNDVLTAKLLAERVAAALGVTKPPALRARWNDLTPRQRDDQRLVRSDVALARGDTAEAARLASEILAAPTNVVAALWAHLVQAEVEQRSGRRGGFEAIRDEARRRGAAWLELQAIAGLIRAGRATPAEWDAAARGMQLVATAGRARDLQLADPPLLWAMT